MYTLISNIFVSRAALCSVLLKLHSTKCLGQIDHFNKKEIFYFYQLKKVFYQILTSFEVEVVLILYTSERALSQSKQYSLLRHHVFLSSRIPMRKLRQAICSLAIEGFRYLVNIISQFQTRKLISWLIEYVYSCLHFVPSTKNVVSSCTKNVRSLLWMNTWKSLYREQESSFLLNNYIIRIVYKMGMNNLLRRASTITILFFSYFVYI